MNKLKIIPAFALGCLLGSPMGRIAVPAGAQLQAQGGNFHVCADKADVLRVVAPTATCPNGQRSLWIKSALSDLEMEKPKDTTPQDTSLDKATLEDVNRRLTKLEEMGCDALEKRRVVAPFEVVDRSGKRIFAVIEEAAGMFDPGGKLVASMVSDQSGGGLFVAHRWDMTVSFGIKSGRLAGFSVSESGHTRLEVGKSFLTGAYKAAFVSASNQQAAAIGGSPETRAGLVLFNDGQGQQRAIMEVIKTGVGRVGVMDGPGKPIVALTEGEQRGGAFYVCAAGGNCDPPMVGAGTNSSGVGVVATGPHFYTGGPTGAPGSFLVGHQ